MSESTVNSSGEDKDSTQQRRSDNPKLSAAIARREDTKRAKLRSDPAHVEAFGLFFDGASASEIAALLGFESYNVARDHIAAGIIEIGEFKASWEELKEFCKEPRVAFAAEKGREWDASAYEQWEKKYKQSSAQSIQKSIDAIVNALDEVNDKGDFLVRRSIRDVPELVKAGLLIQGKATEIREVQTSITQLLGAIVRRHIESHLRQDPDLAGAILTGIRADFQEAIAAPDARMLEEADYDEGEEEAEYEDLE